MSKKLCVIQAEYGVHEFTQTKFKRLIQTIYKRWDYRHIFTGFPTHEILQIYIQFQKLRCHQIFVTNFDVNVDLRGGGAALDAPQGHNYSRVS